MNPAWPISPRRGRLILLIAVTVGLAYAFLSGPSGLVSIMIRRHRVRRLQTDMAGIRDKIAARSAQREWLADPDSAKVLARKLLAPAPDTSGPVAPR